MTKTKTRPTSAALKYGALAALLLTGAQAVHADIAPTLLVGNQNIAALATVVAEAPLTIDSLTSPEGRFIYGLALDASDTTWWSGVDLNLGAAVIGTINPITGATLTAVATTELFTGIAWNGSTLYGMADGPNIDMLGTINPSTGAFTAIGAQQFIDDIAFVGSTLYGLSRNQGLVTIDTSNGAVTDLFAGDELNDDRGMAYIDGTMYIVKTGIRTIDIGTGAITTIGTNAEFGNLQGAVVQAVPEPGSALLAASGLGMLLGFRRRKQAAA